MEKYLDQLKPNESGVVVKLIAEGKIRRRLFDMGITPNAKIIMRKTAPLGDPIEINLRGYQLSIRKDEAKGILIKMENA